MNSMDKKKSLANFHMQKPMLPIFILTEITKELELPCSPELRSKKLEKHTLVLFEVLQNLKTCSMIF